MDGVELADSVCWDAHKMMGLPLVCSAFFNKKARYLAKVVCSRETLLTICSWAVQKIVIWAAQVFNRRNDALKLFLAWREKGDAGWARLVEDYVELADYLQSKVETHPNLEMMSSSVV